MILRNPPGDGSSVTWTAGSTATMALNIEVSDGRGMHREIDPYPEFDTDSRVGTALGPCGVGACALVTTTLAKTFETGSEFTASNINIEGEKHKGLNRGNDITITADVTYSTSADLVGTAARRARPGDARVHYYY